MSGDTTDELVKKLLDHGIGKDRSIAVIEQATTPLQKVFSTGIHRYEKEFGNRSYISPTLIIIGKVASLHEELKWMAENLSTGELYFKPVSRNKQEEVRA
jgi:uroporphyrin-III C-methyltransferase